MRQRTSGWVLGLRDGRGAARGQDAGDTAVPDELSTLHELSSEWISAAEQPLSCARHTLHGRIGEVNAEPP